MTIVADLVRSLVMSGLAAASVLTLIVAGLVATGYLLWRLLRRARFP